MYNAMKWTEAKKRELAAAKRRTHYAEDITLVAIRALAGTRMHVNNRVSLVNLSYSLVPMYLREYNRRSRGYGVNSPSFTTWVAAEQVESFIKEAKRIGAIVGEN